MTAPRVLGLADAQAIRTRAAQGARFAALAREYGVSRETVHRIVRGEIYAEAGGPVVAQPRAQGRGEPEVIMRDESREDMVELEWIEITTAGIGETLHRMRGGGGMQGALTSARRITAATLGKRMVADYRRGVVRVGGEIEIPFAHVFFGRRP